MKYSILLAFLFILNGLSAQERVKVDGVAVVIGDNIVLDSDLGKFKKITASNGR